MLKQRFAPVLSLVLALFAPVAHAYLDPRWITPENPRTGQAISVRIHGAFCDAILEATGYPQIVQEVDAVLFLVPAFMKKT